MMPGIWFLLNCEKCKSCTFDGMRYLITLIFGTIVLAGCKNNNAPNPTPVQTNSKIYLLSAAAYTRTSGAVVTDHYTYDTLNRLVQLNALSIGRVFNYTYDNNNNVTTVKYYDPFKHLLYTDSYTYAGSIVSGTRTYGVSNIIKFTIASNATQPLITYTSATETINYNITPAGDLSSYLITGTTGGVPPTDSYTYDDKHNPLSMIAGNNVHLSLFAFPYPESFVHNITSSITVNASYRYTYNDDGFPVSVDVISPTSITSHIDYQYIVK